jgi:hypothetical protein
MPLLNRLVLIPTGSRFGKDEDRYPFDEPPPMFIYEAQYVS